LLSLSQVATNLPCLKVEACLLSLLPKNTTGKPAGLSLHYTFDAERQAGKL